MIRDTHRVIVGAAAIWYCASALAQPILKPSIGIASLPVDSVPICAIPTYTGGFDASGLQAGDTAADFTLYDLNGDPVNLEAVLMSGKPALLIASSYTCPVFRTKIPDINMVVAAYSTQLSVLVIYTLEAHPDIDISPYSGFVNPTQANIDAGILYRQPTAYGERKAILGDMLDSLTIDAPLLIDGPCNEWWSYYGPAPNNAYLIDTTGIVFSKHAWFDRFPDDIVCDIDSMLGNPTSCVTAANGTFTLVLTSDTVAQGTPGETIYCTADIVNNSGADVLVQVRRLQNNIPGGWATSMCLDACLPSHVDTTTVLVPAGQTQHYVMYFFTDNVANNGSTVMMFRNKNLPANRFFQGFVGMTDEAIGIAPKRTADVKVFPNPASSWLMVSTAGNGVFELYDLNGRLMMRVALPSGETSTDVESLSSGLHLWRVMSDGGVASGVVMME